MENLRRTTEAVNKRAVRAQTGFGEYGIIDLRLFLQFIASDNAFGMRLTEETASFHSTETETLFSRHTHRTSYPLGTKKYCYSDIPKV